MLLDFVVNLKQPKKMLYKLLAVLLTSALFTGALIVPFINLLYWLRFRTPVYPSRDFLGRKTKFNELHSHKKGTPTGGGILLILSAFLFLALFYGFTQYRFNWTSNILFLTMFLFGLLGLYDDIQKFFGFTKKGVWGFRARYKILLQAIFGAVVGWLLYSQMGLHSVFIPFVQSQLILPAWIYISFAVLVIVASTNAFNITDGLDGLSTGLLLIALVPFWVLTSSTSFGADLSLFIAVIFGVMLPYLYFNIHPARLFMGDTGALALGAMLGVMALMSNQVVAWIFVGGVFVVEASSTLIQWGSFLFRHGKKVFLIAPLHHHFEALGWDETKVTMRFWLAGILFALLGLFVATFGR